MAYGGIYTMLLSEMLDKKRNVATKDKTIKVRFCRDLLSGGQCYETLNGKKTYVLVDGLWFTAFGKSNLDYNFIIIE